MAAAPACTNIDQSCIVLVINLQQGVSTIAKF
jgi:hypothetical protein